MLLELLFESGFADSSFARLFTEMSPWAIVLFVLGALFCVIELMIPGFGFFGIGGIAMLVAAIVIRMVTGGDVLMLIYMLLMCGALCGLLFLLLGKFIQNRQKNPRSLFTVQPAVPTDKTAGTKDFSYLVGQKGTTLTVLKPVGKAMFGSDCVDVVARDGFIDQDKTITVVSVEGQRVIVVE